MLLTSELDMKLSVISTGESVTGSVKTTGVLLPTFIIERDVKFHFQASEHKDLFPPHSCTWAPV